MVRFIAIILMITALYANAEVFYNQNEQGWYWYDENKIQNENDVLHNPQMTIESAKIELETLKQSIEDKKALALMYPTEQNIKEYVQLQNEVNRRSEEFAMTWQKVIIKNPELDHTVKNPTNAVARRVYHEDQAQQKKSSVSSFTNKYGLFFFFRSNCPYCHKFSPILKMFEEEYGITVVPVSLDGKGLPEYPHPKADNGIASKLNVDIVPAVIAVDPKSGEIVPVSYGLVSVDELSYRINLLSEDEKGAKK
jgi:conjugal transfer pilus assembly protein TraF